MNATEVSAAAEKKTVERDDITKDKGKADIAAAVANLAAGGMGFAGVEGRCAFLARVICAT
jgi:hypothetical protein